MQTNTSGNGSRLSTESCSMIINVAVNCHDTINLAGYGADIGLPWCTIIAAAIRCTYYKQLQYAWPLSEMSAVNNSGIRYCNAKYKKVLLWGV